VTEPVAAEEQDLGVKAAMVQEYQEANNLAVVVLAGYHTLLI